MSTSFDLVVTGAGIVGLAHAAEAHSRGLSVCVLDRDQRAVGASIRNFGHIGTSVQGGRARQYAEVARERWLTLGEKAGFEVQQVGTLIVARTGPEHAVLQELATARPEETELLTAPQVRALFPLATEEVVAGALLPRDLRVDPRAAVPALASWLEAEGVVLRWGTTVTGYAPGVVHTSRGDLAGERIVHASGHDVDRLFPDVAERYGVRRCRLHMLEVVPPGGVRIDPAVLTGTAILRYSGLAELDSAAAVRAEFERDHPELAEIALNLMLTQRPDGSIVLGDSHHYAHTHLPFDDERVTELLLREGSRLLGADLTVRRRWRGVYADSPSTDFLVAEAQPGVRVVSVTSGIGMTTALGLAPAVLDDLL